MAVVAIRRKAEATRRKAEAIRRSKAEAIRRSKVVAIRRSRAAAGSSAAAHVRSTRPRRGRCRFMTDDPARRSSSAEDADVIAAIRAGDEAAFASLGERYRRQLRVHC